MKIAHGKKRVSIQHRALTWARMQCANLTLVAKHSALYMLGVLDIDKRFFCAKN